MRSARTGSGALPIPTGAIPTAPVAGASLIVGYAVVVASGSRPLGGIVMLLGGIWCVIAWARRHGRRTAVTLAAVGFAAFVISHILGLLIGAWAAVVLVAAGTALAAWRLADSRGPGGLPPRVAPASSGER